MAKYILYEETDEGKSVIGEYKRKCDLEDDAIKFLYSMVGDVKDLETLKFSEEDEFFFEDVMDNVKYLMKNGDVIYRDNRYTYEKK